MLATELVPATTPVQAPSTGQTGMEGAPARRVRRYLSIVSLASSLLLVPGTAAAQKGRLPPHAVETIRIRRVNQQFLIESVHSPFQEPSGIRLQETPGQLFKLYEQPHAVLLQETPGLQLRPYDVPFQGLRNRAR
jgi:hypothetical protein